MNFAERRVKREEFHFGWGMARDAMRWHFSIFQLNRLIQ
jgi:hypothetical protein